MASPRATKLDYPAPCVNAWNPLTFWGSGRFRRLAGLRGSDRLAPVARPECHSGDGPLASRATSGPARIEGPLELTGRAMAA